MTRRNSSPALEPRWDYDALCIELLVALRGRRSRRAFSSRLGYRSNMVQRWETGECVPKAGVFLSACERAFRVGLRSAHREMFQRPAPWRAGAAPLQALPAFLAELRGGKTVVEISRQCGKNRFAIARWLKGQAEPTLPELLQLIEVMSGRMLDFIAGLTDPNRLPSAAAEWQLLELSRELAYQSPWGHAVLRALRLDSCPSSDPAPLAEWISSKLSLSVDHSEQILRTLMQGGYVRRGSTGWETVSPERVDTGRDTRQALALKQHWTRVAQQRLSESGAGSFGYSLFEISKKDLLAAKAIHLDYVKALQGIVKRSSGTDRVGLYCAQLIDLSSADNAFD